MDSLNSKVGRNIGCLSLACLLTACAVGPDYRAPDVPVPDAWHSQPQTGVKPDSAETPLLASWWTVLNDPTLNQLIDQALANNLTLRQAKASVVEARARRAITGASFWPWAGASAGGSRSDSDLNGNQESWAGGVDASWEIDLFGGQRRAFESSTAQLAAADAELRDVLVSLLGEVALAYVDVRTSQSRLSYAERNLESQREVVDIAGWRAEAGLATVLDVEQAKSSYSTTLAALPSLESALEAGKNRLAVLTGQTPGSLAQLLSERRPIPVAPAEVVSSVPADVMRRRPDIRAAERRLAAQTAQVGVATAELYPRLSLNGSIGVTAGSAGDLFSGAAQSSRYGLSLSMPIFRAGAIRQGIKVTNAQVDRALAAYEATVLFAYEEVENSLTQWVNEQRRHVALIDSADSARLASELALTQYNSGLVDFQTVLTADRQLISAEDALAVSEGEMTANLIQLYKALGGGWSVFPPPAIASNEVP